MVSKVLYSLVVTGCGGLQLSTKHGEPEYERCDTIDTCERSEETVSETNNAQEQNELDRTVDAMEEMGLVVSGDRDRLDQESNAFLSLQIDRINYAFDSAGAVTAQEGVEVEVSDDEVDSCMCSSECVLSWVAYVVWMALGLVLEEYFGPPCFQFFAIFANFFLTLYICAANLIVVHEIVSLTCQLFNEQYMFFDRCHNGLVLYVPLCCPAIVVTRISDCLVFLCDSIQHILKTYPVTVCFVLLIVTAAFVFG